MPSVPLITIKQEEEICIIDADDDDLGIINTVNEEISDFY